MRARIASRCGPIFGASQMRVTSRCASDAASRANAFGRVGEEDRGIRAAPARVGGREMRADVALAERAVDRVGERVQRDVGVRMALELLVVRDEHAPEPDAVAGREGVNVEALADADLGRLRAISRASASRKSCMVVTFRLPGSPSNTIDGMAGLGSDGGVVGEIGACRARGAPRGSDRSGTPAASAPRAARRAPARRRSGLRRRPA